MCKRKIGQRRSIPISFSRFAFAHRWQETLNLHGKNSCEFSTFGNSKKQPITFGVYVSIDLRVLGFLSAKVSCPFLSSDALVSRRPYELDNNHTYIHLGGHPGFFQGKGGEVTLWGACDAALVEFAIYLESLAGATRANFKRGWTGHPELSSSSGFRKWTSWINLDFTASLHTVCACFKTSAVAFFFQLRE